jgi:hypothetical protein
VTVQILTGTDEELADRESNGIRVSLIWNRDDDSVRVFVYDASTDSAFQLEVGEASPLDVFNHPFAYAAFRRVACDGPVFEASADPVAA